MRKPPLIAYYGDDFTGSTDVMEALSANGVETVLFTRIPSDAFRSRFASCRAVGLAGTSRSRSPDWMDAELPAIFDWLAATGARFLHYKVCSTFDSAPRRGNIGRAVEIGRRQFRQDTVPILVGAPQLRRYTFAGHLFAAYRGKIYRIDRHPVMSQHPATPMTESDLLLHLAAQTDLDSTLICDADEPVTTSAMVLLDVRDEATQHRAGAWLERFAERLKGTPGPFIVGSSGVEYALLPNWAANGDAAPRPSYRPLPTQPRIAVVSGSCSPTTARQIETASNCGFSCIPVDYKALVSGTGAEAAYEKAMIAAAAALSDGRSTIVYTALGPAEALTEPEAGNDDRVGKALGRMISTLRLQHGLDRIVVAGGDTSSHALGEMEIGALTLRHPIAESPGSPVCCAHPDGTETEPFELVLKGGQIGGDDYFIRMRDGNV
ncbi:four-carbon acid sugar kinase family protein [Rhodospirillaceae bacterium KN72]|uniref:Four-carbon acid sugar kinase family protein n=1 Tax=Pacificispira spongiicola TaxID=2729598 RepID=A0A7Y0DY27_9PROT|nr:four-carbon acid sugar kinase family protein [Pacificispira spongiicola]NMM43693.1 four-carbon acid sugar kinase family protein [Pacificispira spongiicola]